MEYIALHFGERCNPYIIINLMLKRNIKTLFQLAIYPFNTIVAILEDNNFDELIKIDNLRYNGDPVCCLENDEHHNYNHTNKMFTNIKYKDMSLLHDFAVNSNNIINNYNFINKSFQAKKENFYNAINSEKCLCFITFLYDTLLKDLKLHEMHRVLKNKYKLKSFIIIIFTHEINSCPDEINSYPDDIKIIYLGEDYRSDHKMEYNCRVKLYDNIWIKYCDVLKQYGFTHDSFDKVFDYNLKLPGM
jgi:hypothetical protein